MSKYLIRLDDACPTMNHMRWEKVLSVLKKNDIKALIGIIPYNHDKDTMPCKPDMYFWEKMRKLESNGYIIALHGYDHCYLTDCGGINPVHHRSEFAGLPYKIQAEKIAKGYALLTKEGLKPKVFFAPSHTFDTTTIKALRDTTPIRIISDTIDYRPYKQHGITILPQQMGQCRRIPLPGYWTFCLHPNIMSAREIANLDHFLSQYRRQFIGFDELIKIKPAKRQSPFGRILSILFRTKRLLIHS